MTTDALRILSILAQSSSAAIAMPADIQAYPLEQVRDESARQEERAHREEDSRRAPVAAIAPLGMPS